MSTDIRILRSTAPSMRPLVSDLESGQPMANIESSDPGLYFRLDNGMLMKVGPSHVGPSAPNSSPAQGGQTGNSVGETWVDTSNSGLPLLKVYTPSGWLTVSTKGETGDKGQKGQKGFKGEDSTVEGPKGEKGQKGFKGVDGSGGSSGSKGEKGEKGRKGEVGAKGEEGSDGQKGEVGQKGEESTVAGPKGQKGEVGSGGNVGGVMDASVIPDTNSAYDLGSAEYKIRHLYLSDNSIYFGDSELPLSVISDELTFAGTALMPFTLTAVLAALDVQSFIGKAAAVAGGLQIGDIYFNSTENRLTSVTA
jgi:hypothetical protein